MRKTKGLTNVELVTDMMEFSKYGALSQIFIIEAIGRYADQCTEELTPEALAEYEKKGSFINMNAWLGVAKEIKERLENR